MRSFEQVSTSMQRGPRWSLQATIADGRQIDTNVGAWLPTKRGRTQITAMVAAANGWIEGWRREISADRPTPTGAPG